MTPAKQTPESELPRAIAEARGREIINEDEYYDDEGKLWVVGDYNPDVFLDDLDNPLIINDQFHELTGDPETHAKICDVLSEWFGEVEREPITAKKLWLDFWRNPTYLTENGGWRAWWLRAYLHILLNGE